MSEPSVARKLAAILSADVEGYSRLMQDDDVETVRTLTAYRNLMAGKIREHKGRVVDSPGDNLLAEFGSVVDALECAVEIQQELREANEALPEHRRMAFRIGLNLGDVIEDGNRIYGDGVNIAARMEGLAEGGGICISGSAYDQVRNKVPAGFEHLGKKSVKNIEEPVRAYRVLPEPAAAGTLIYRDKRHDPKHRRRVHIALAAGLCLLALAGAIHRWTDRPARHPMRKLAEKIFQPTVPDKPSLAVLPFTNMSEEAGQEYFSDGLTDDLITDLSKISGLLVISRNSAFAYKGKNVRIEEIGRDLGVRYVLEGSVRRAGDRVRINAQLIDTKTGGHVWAERYDRELEEIFGLQDEVRHKIVEALAVQLTPDEQERLGIKGTQNVEAYDYFLRGMEFYAHKNREGLLESRKMFAKAVELDPSYAEAYATLGHSYLTEWIFGWTEDPRSLELAFELGRKAVAISPQNGAGHSVLGHVHLWRKQHEQAIEESRRAVSLDPNNSDWIAGLGEQYTWAGQPELAIDLLIKAIRLNPKYPAWYLWNLGHAYYLSGEHELAVDAFQRTLNVDPGFWPSHAFLALAYQALGKDREAATEASEVLRLDPSMTLAKWKKHLPYKDTAVVESMIRVWARLGLQ